jgi:hypothetical protein
VHLDDERNFVSDERVGRLIGLGSNPQLEVAGSKVGQVQHFHGRTDAVVGRVLASHANVFHLKSNFNKELRKNYFELLSKIYH